MIRGFPKNLVFEGQNYSHTQLCQLANFTPTHVKFALLFSLFIEH